MATFYSESPEEVLSSLKTSAIGLTSQEAETRLKQYGSNKLIVKNTVSALGIFFRQFQNPLTIILIIATALILFIYFAGERDQADLIEAGLIFAIILLIAVLGFIQEYKAEKAVEALRKLMAFTAIVRRDGHEVEVSVDQLVPGDIIVLDEGKRVSADIRLLEVYGLQTSEASLTGESTPVTKNEKQLLQDLQTSDQINMVFSGTTIVSGRGIGVVTSTGNQTEIGKIALSVAKIQDEATPLQKNLAIIGKRIGYLVIGISVVVFVFIVFFAQEFSNLPLLEKTIHSFIAAVALAVAAIPEGLPAVVTISLALGTQRMLKKNSLVKKLSSVETLGSTDIICSDKTGTLTKGEMTVTEVFINQQLYTVSGTGFETIGEFKKNGIKAETAELVLLLECGAECNNASLDSPTLVLGDPTEAALLVSAAKAGITKRAKRVFEVPFSSGRKMMSVVVEKNDGYVVFTKGAPEILLLYCTIQMSETAEQILAQTHTMSEKALRTLGFAYRKFSRDEFEKARQQPDLLEQNLTFLGLQGMIDPPREEVKDLISICNASGIRVIMITGDHQDTARAVASEIGIGGSAINGSDLSKLSRNALAETVKIVNIYARINPEDKLKIVEALKHEKHVVAMTGDGVNDAPALKRADIGIAMGKTGTDVAKEASDVIILDDHFGSIIKAVEEGRGIYINIKKFVHYLLACNLAEVAIVLSAVFLLRDLPFTATMLLWINVVTDGLPALALSLDPPPDSIMKAVPRQFQKAIIEKNGWISMAIFAFLVTIGVLAIYILNLPEGKMEASSAAFMTLIAFELVKVFLIRQTYGTRFLSNPWLFVAVIGTIALQLVIVQVPSIAQIFSIKAIDPSDFALIAGLCAVLWISFSFIQKFFLVKLSNSSEFVVSQ